MHPVVLGAHLEVAREAKVGDLVVVAGGDEDIARGDVAVDELEPREVQHPLGDLDADLHANFHRDGEAARVALHPQQVEQRPALAELEDDHGAVVPGDDAEDLQYVDVIELRHQHRLAKEVLTRADRCVGANRLDGHVRGGRVLAQGAGQHPCPEHGPEVALPELGLLRVRVAADKFFVDLLGLLEDWSDPAPPVEAGGDKADLLQLAYLVVKVVRLIEVLCLARVDKHDRHDAVEEDKGADNGGDDGASLRRRRAFLRRRGGHRGEVCVAELARVPAVAQATRHHAVVRLRVGPAHAMGAARGGRGRRRAGPTDPATVAVAVVAVQDVQDHRANL